MARDLFHQTVREALEADGWIITHDPFAETIAEESVSLLVYDVLTKRIVQWITR